MRQAAASLEQQLREVQQRAQQAQALLAEERRLWDSDWRTAKETVRGHEDRAGTDAHA